MGDGGGKGTSDNNERAAPMKAMLYHATRVLIFGSINAL